MSQYRASMMRYWGLEKAEAAAASDVEKSAPAETAEAEQSGAEAADEAALQYSPPPPPAWTQGLRKQADYILYVLSPVIWAFMLVLFLDRDALIKNMFMPFLGVFAALLANTVPIGGGIVYVPMLSLFGEKIQLGVAFSVATMAFGNGVFGFLHWLKADPSLILWESFQYTIFPSWAGSALGILVLPAVSGFWVKQIFGLFSLLLAGYVFLLATSTSSHGSSSAVTPPAAPTVEKWRVVAVVSFLAGIILVTNIGVGPALITFVLLGSNYLGFTHKQAIVTGIITGGWVCLVPLIIHLFILNDVPFALWLTVLPGVFVGARVAPTFFELVGINRVLWAFGFFLVASAGTFLL
jgi:uncharacterized membrane protein YfcA